MTTGAAAEVVRILGYSAMVGAIGYSVLALVALAIRRPGHIAKGSFAGDFPELHALPGVTILKPLCGSEPGLYQNLRSFCTQRYPCYQIIFGVRDAADLALPVARRLQAEFPHLQIDAVVDPAVHGSNLKVSNLINMIKFARHPWLVLADSDIVVEDTYLAKVTAPLADPIVGIVTCLYRGKPRAGPWSWVGAGFINDWFCPSVYVASALGSQRFGFGSTIAIRRATLDLIGGFDTLKNLLADDFWLGEFTRRQGKQTVLSFVEVTTDVIETKLLDLWRREIRWLRTIRSLAPIGFAFSFVTLTFPLMAAGVILAPSHATYVAMGVGVLLRSLLHWQLHRTVSSQHRIASLALLPIRDFFTFVEWMVAPFNSLVRWRGEFLDSTVNRELRKRPASRGLIITADDFGLHAAVNEGVEIAHRAGVLTAASLMVSGAAAADAIARSRQLPKLRIGLHLVLADGQPTLPRERISRLVNGAGRFGSRMTWNGIRFFLLPSVRRELADEIRAQFEAYKASGLILDHVNSHKHFHLHPTVLSLVIKIGADFDLRCVRLPLEPGSGWIIRLWSFLAARRLHAAGIEFNDQVYGIIGTGSMDESNVIKTLRKLPPGLSEIYFHPATQSGSDIAESMAGYRHQDELAALLSPRVRDTLDAISIPRGGFRDLTAVL